MAGIRPLDTECGCRARGLKVLEEAAEACEALKQVERRAQSGDGPSFRACRADALQELADVAQTLCDALSSLGATAGEWEGACGAVRRRNLDRGRCFLEGAGALSVEWEGAE